MSEENNEKIAKNENSLNRVSNSRLSAQGRVHFDISFDRITVVGDLDENEETAFSLFLANSIYFNVFESHVSQVKGQAVDGSVFFEYDKFKGKARERRNMRIEFNPNNLDQKIRDLIKTEFIARMRNKSFSRLDLAFDCFENLKDYFVFSDRALKKTIIYGRSDAPETKYFGVRDSDRYIRIYNKKQEIKDNKDLEIDHENFWRIEFELKRDMTEQWQNCFDDLHFLIPNWKNIEEFDLRAKIFYLLNDEDAWGEIHRNTKAKYRKIIKEISSVDLQNDMQQELEKQRDRLKKELQFWSA